MEPQEAIDIARRHETQLVLAWGLRVAARVAAVNERMPKAIERIAEAVALAQDIVHLHHGELHVVSEPGEGAEFTIELKKDSGLLQKAI